MASAKNDPLTTRIETETKRLLTIYDEKLLRFAAKSRELPLHDDPRADREALARACAKHDIEKGIT